MHLYVGTPGSCKSTHAAAFLAEHPEYNLVCPDHYREQLTGDMSDQSANSYIFQTLIPQAIGSAALMRQHCLYDATNVSIKARKPIIKLAKENGFWVVAKVMRTSYEDCVRRNAARDRVVPSFVLEKMRDAWQEPTLEEGFDEVGDITVEPLPPIAETSEFTLDETPQVADTPDMPSSSP
jgi:predicted kinase